MYLRIKVGDVELEYKENMGENRAEPKVVSGDKVPNTDKLRHQLFMDQVKGLAKIASETHEKMYGGL